MLGGRDDDVRRTKPAPEMRLTGVLSNSDRGDNDDGAGVSLAAVGGCTQRTASSGGLAARDGEAYQRSSQPNSSHSISVPVSGSSGAGSGPGRPAASSPAAVGRSRRCGAGALAACAIAAFILLMAGGAWWTALWPPGFIAPRWSPRRWLEDRRWAPPLVTRDAWRAYADHICDPVQCAVQYDPSLVRPGDVVFIKIDVASQYLADVAPRIAAAHIVVAHDGDNPFTAAHAAALDGQRRIVAWFSQNIDAGVVHPRLHAVPIGIEDRRYATGKFPEILTKLPRFANFQVHAARGRALIACAALLAQQERASGASNGDVGAAGKGGAEAQLQAVLPAECTAFSSGSLVYSAFNTATNPPVRTAAAAALARMPWVTSHVSGFEGVRPSAEVLAADEASITSHALLRGLQPWVPPRCWQRYDAAVTAGGADVVRLYATADGALGPSAPLPPVGGASGSRSLRSSDGFTHGSPDSAFAPSAPQSASDAAIVGRSRSLAASGDGSGAAFPVEPSAPPFHQNPGAVPGAVWQRAQSEGMPPSQRDMLTRNFEAIRAHPFTASPPGNGLQSHRTWEALYGGGVPIVLRFRNAMDSVHDGLPVALVDEYSEGTMSRQALLGILARCACVWDNTLRDVFAADVADNVPAPAPATSAAAAAAAAAGGSGSAAAAASAMASAAAVAGAAGRPPRVVATGSMLADPPPPATDSNSAATAARLLPIAPQTQTQPQTQLQTQLQRQTQLQKQMEAQKGRATESIPTDKADGLDGTVFEMERLYAGYWLQRVDRARLWSAAAEPAVSGRRQQATRA